MGTCSVACCHEDGSDDVPRLVFVPGVYKVAGHICVRARADPESRIVCMLQDRAEVELVRTKGNYIQVDGPVRGFIPFINPTTKECSLHMSSYEDRKYVEPPRNIQTLTPISSPEQKSEESFDPPKHQNAEEIQANVVEFKYSIDEDSLSELDDTPSSSVQRDDHYEDSLQVVNTNVKTQRAKTITLEDDPFTPVPRRVKTRVFPKSAPVRQAVELLESPESIELGEQIKDDLALHKLKKMRRVTKVRKQGLKYWDSKPVERKDSGETKKLRKVKKVKKQGFKFWEKMPERKISETLLALQKHGRVEKPMSPTE